MAPRNNTEEPPAKAISNARDGNHTGLFVIIIWDHGTIVPKRLKKLMVAVFGRL